MILRKKQQCDLIKKENQHSRAFHEDRRIFI